jgi:hypothetical protein
MRCAQYDGQNGFEPKPRVGDLYIGDGSPHFLIRSGGILLSASHHAGLGKLGL